jgi:HJR/Mrr/RecB family endonuclease
MTDNFFIFDRLYDHKTVMKELAVGNSGGVRVSKGVGKTVNRVVLFSSSEQEANPQENPYRDHLDGSILTYTGTGKIGHQNLTGPNLRITQQRNEFYPIYVFSLVKHRKAAGSPEQRWRFAGIYKYLDHGRQEQADLLGIRRDVWIFKLFRLNIAQAHPSIEAEITREIIQAYGDPLLRASVLLGSLSVFPSVQIESSIKQMEDLTPFAFEHFIKKTLIASDFREVRVTKKSSDGGIDITAKLPISIWPLESQIIQIQAKRWQRPVGRREVAQLRGSLDPRAMGVIITTGNYARTAIIEAEKANQLPISLIDGHKLAIASMRLNLEIN